MDAESGPILKLIQRTIVGKTARMAGPEWLMLQPDLLAAARATADDLAQWRECLACGRHFKSIDAYVRHCAARSSFPLLRPAPSGSRLEPQTSLALELAVSRASVLRLAPHETFFAMQTLEDNVERA